jgi:hypothetical protein
MRDKIPLTSSSHANVPQKFGRKPNTPEEGRTERQAAKPKKNQQYRSTKESRRVPNSKPATQEAVKTNVAQTREEIEETIRRLNGKPLSLCQPLRDMSIIADLVRMDAHEPTGDMNKEKGDGKVPS